ncbi:hypothetical protein [Pseudomonas neuropathica]|uniref:hypothetical protein n=1 Tax=Pseudomonas neuropathica TaxID=2730425 RepID=UPI003EB9C8A4
MSTPDKPDTEPFPPTITFPEEGKETGVATLFLGSGTPEALVQVWNIEETYSLGGGKVSANGRWAFSFSGAQYPGEHGIKAPQEVKGEMSDWSDVRSYTVVLRPEIEVPVVFEPKEGAQVNTTPFFSGNVTKIGGFVSIFNLDTGKEIAQAKVDNLRWSAQVTEPLPLGLCRTSAIHNIVGTVSDWSRVRTFTVTAEGKGKGKT